MPDARVGALAALVADITEEARRAPFDRCVETYAAAARDVDLPILCKGSLDAPYCALGRELGRDEVLLGEPLIGMGGRRFRRAFHDAILTAAAKDERRFEAIFERVLLTNLVPYRPVDNKAYDRATLARFRPFTERLLGDLWTGHTILALGETSLRWLAPYAADGAVDALWGDPARRFVDTVPATIRGRAVTIAPVPHPSPLSPFKHEFGTILRRRVSGG